MVSVRREWWDDEVFEAYPTWDDAVEDRCNYFAKPTAKNSSWVLLEKYFGKSNENGPSHYSKSAKYGIGREVLSKMLSETKSDIEQALTSLPLTARAKRGLELQAEEERLKPTDYPPSIQTFCCDVCRYQSRAETNRLPALDSNSSRL